MEAIQGRFTDGGWTVRLKKNRKRARIANWVLIILFPYVKKKE